MVVQKSSDRRAKPPERWSLLRFFFPTLGHDGVPVKQSCRVLLILHRLSLSLKNDLRPISGMITITHSNNFTWMCKSQTNVFMVCPRLYSYIVTVQSVRRNENHSQFSRDVPWSGHAVSCLQQASHFSRSYTRVR